MVDVGRLKSPLPDSELILSMIRKLQQSYHLNTEESKALAKRDFKSFLVSFEKELELIQDVAEKAKVRLVRLEDSLKPVESTLNNYRRNLEKRKKDPSVKPLLQLFDTLLIDIRKIKNKIIEEARRSRREEGKIIRNV